MFGGYAQLSELPEFAGNQHPFNPNHRSNYEQETDPSNNIFRGSNHLFARELGLIFIGGIIFIISFLWKDYLTDLQNVILSDDLNLWTRFIFIFVITMLGIGLVLTLRNYLKLSSRSASFEFDDSPVENNTNIDTSDE